MQRVKSGGREIVVFETTEATNPVNQAVAVSELEQGNTVSLFGISVHTENKEQVLVVEGKDYRTPKNPKDVISSIAKYQRGDRILASLALMPKSD